LGQTFSFIIFYEGKVMKMHLFSVKYSSRFIVAMLLTGGLMIAAAPAMAQSISHVNSDGTMQDPGFLNAQNASGCVTGQPGCTPVGAAGNSSNPINAMQSGSNSSTPTTNGVGSVSNGMPSSLSSTTAYPYNSGSINGGAVNSTASGNTPAGSMTGNASSASSAGIGAGIRR